MLKLAAADARKRVLERVMADPAYRVAQEEVDRLEQRVLELRMRDRFGELPRASREWIEAKSKTGRMVATALSEDPEVHSTEAILQGLGVIRPWMGATTPVERAARDEAASDASASSQNGANDEILQSR